jgi:hypothetical protein
VIIPCDTLFTTCVGMGLYKHDQGWLFFKESLQDIEEKLTSGARLQL